jgi:hypothetical protein
LNILLIECDQMKLEGEGRLPGRLREKVYECGKSKVLIVKALIKVERRLRTILSLIARDEAISHCEERSNLSLRGTKQSAFASEVVESILEGFMENASHLLQTIRYH